MILIDLAMIIGVVVCILLAVVTRPTKGQKP
jgi:hypothetical protein